jgi:hypothetical protein
MHFPYLLNPQRSVVQVKPKLPAETVEEEVREPAAKVAEADEWQRQALMQSFAPVRIQFEDLGGQTGLRYVMQKTHCCQYVLG